jgi:type I restriction enzyme S subunit
MARYPVVLPPEPLAKAFTELVRPAISHILISIHQNSTLADLRDTLMPRLISGELRLPSAERIVEGRE